MWSSPGVSPLSLSDVAFRRPVIADHVKMRRYVSDRFDGTLAIANGRKL